VNDHWETITGVGGNVPLASIHESRLVNWSLLTILFASNDAWCSYEVETGAGSGRSLPHLWREAGGKM
jgi:hypothetical protein